MLYHHLTREVYAYIIYSINLIWTIEMKQDFEEMKKQAAEASGVLKAIANETRLLILCSIIEDDFTVNQLSEITGMGQSAVSQHLKVLSEQNIVSPKRMGKKIIYKIADPKAKAILVLMHALFCK